MSLAGLDVTMFIAFSNGYGRWTPKSAITSPARAPAALTVSFARIVELAFTDEVSRDHPADPSAVSDRRDRFDVVREVGARQVRRGREGDRQPLALDDLVVVPLRAAGQILRFDSGEQPKRGRLGNQLGAGQVQFRLDAVVAVSAEPGIDPERRAQRDSALDRGSIGADEKRQRAQEPRRDAGERAAFVNRFARAIESC